ncbi:MAG: AMP-binding protein, partial [Salinibacter sp.]|uniref:AMP-binding protein n=1 Tax=Salinibacter sp. TaxID=2065818 RepID=UPI002FC296CA
STQNPQPEMNLVELLQAQARERPDVPALIEYDGGRHACTFADLERRAARGAALLRTAGVGDGDVVLVLQPMSTTLYVIVTALLRVGAVAMVPDPAADRAHIAECCERAEPTALVGPPRAHLLRLLSRPVWGIPEAFVTGHWPLPFATRWPTAPAPRGTQAEAADCDADTPALLTFTSGSTGAPKGAVRTHGLLRAQYEALRDNLNLQPGQIDLATLPVFVLANLAAGVSTVLTDADLRAPAQIDPAPVIDQIQTEEPTRTTASPAFFERLMDAEAGPLDRFERLYTGGAPVFPDLLDRMRAAAPSAEIVAVYGSTEAEPIAHVAESDIRPDDRRRMVAGGGLLAGVPVDEVELRILPDRYGTPIGPFSRDEFKAATCPPNTPGEVVVAGPHVVPGYLDGRGDAENKFEVDGTRWHRTGDAGRLDAEGRLWLLGRCDATVRDDRGTLHPFAVECGARLHDDVRHAALAPWKGRRVLAVEPQSPDTGVDREGLRDQLADVTLDEIVVLPDIPLDRRHNAKVDYPALADRLDRALSSRP